jgi:tetratricopeptide (TPR) repeat protein
MLWDDLAPIRDAQVDLQMGDEPVYRGLLGIDVEGFSRPEWTDPIRARLRGRLYRLVDDGLAHAQIAPSMTERNDTGDGLLLLVDAEVSTARLLHPLVTAVASGLDRDNRQAPAAQRMRLRIVVHAGQVLHDTYGYTGDDLIHAFRLLNAEATRAVLAGSAAAAMVLVVSDVVYDGVVRHAYHGIDPAAWQPVRVHAKETSTRAWVHLPGLSTQPRLPTVLVAPRVGPASLPIPRELPRPPGDFTGRGSELAALLDLLDTDGQNTGGAGTPATAPRRPVVITAIDGMGGIGKSALAIQAANQLADRFSDGQLYVNLQGATAGLAPLDPLEALGSMLRTLGLDPAAIPAEVEEAAARFRSLAAERRLLVLLDNAASAQQVRPMLPGSPTCGVLVTSRQVLATLEGVHPMHLDVLPYGQALELLGRIAGQQRIAVDPQAAAEVVRLCGHLPLAVRIAGARLAARPTWPVQVLAERLADATRRLEELAAGELAVWASFEVSLHALQHSEDPVDQAAAAAFGLLSLPDGPDLGVAAAARLLDQPEPATQRLLERLVDAQLMETPQPGRYQFHDLLRVYARQHAARRHPDPERLTLLTRTIAFYTATAWHTMALLVPGDRRLASADPQWTNGGLRFRDAPAALAWLEGERANLLAAIAQAAGGSPPILAGLGGQLTRALFGLFEMHSYWQDGVQANQIALTLARSSHDRAAQAHALNDLAVGCERLGRYAEAIDCQQESLAICRELDDRRGQAVSLGNLGSVYERLGRYAEAIDCQQESLAICRELDDRRGQANGLANLGIAYERVGRYPEAMDCQQESLAMWRELDDRRGQAVTVESLGEVYERLGRYAEAIDCLQESLAICRELGDRWGQADSLNSLGLVHERLGRYAEAIDCQQESINILREVGDRYGQAVALRDLGDALRAAGSPQQAQVAWREALAIFETLQIPKADEIRERLAT